MADKARTVRVISHDCAQALVAGAIRHAAANGWKVAAVVLDPSGHLVAAGRMDGVPPPILDYATDKAYTATLGRPTSAFFQRMSSSPALAMGAANRPRLCAWDGGVPVYQGADLLGAIGVSGAASDEDVACAAAALGEQGLSDSRS